MLGKVVIGQELEQRTSRKRGCWGSNLSSWLLLKWHVRTMFGTIDSSFLSSFLKILWDSVPCSCQCLPCLAIKCVPVCVLHLQISHVIDGTAKLSTFPCFLYFSHLPSTLGSGVETWHGECLSVGSPRSRPRQGGEHKWFVHEVKARG